MAAVVWFTIGLAIWHFTVFVPDRFWGGIVGALLGAVAGAMVTGRDRADRLRPEHRPDGHRNRPGRNPRAP